MKGSHVSQPKTVPWLPPPAGLPHTPSKKHHSPPVHDHPIGSLRTHHHHHKEPAPASVSIAVAPAAAVATTTTTSSRWRLSQSCKDWFGLVFVVGLILFLGFLLLAAAIASDHDRRRIDELHTTVRSLKDAMHIEGADTVANPAGVDSGNVRPRQQHSAETVRMYLKSQAGNADGGASPWNDAAPPASMTLTRKDTTAGTTKTRRTCQLVAYDFFIPKDTPVGVVRKIPEDGGGIPDFDLKNGLCSQSTCCFLEVNVAMCPSPHQLGVVFGRNPETGDTIANVKLYDTALLGAWCTMNLGTPVDEPTQ